MLTVIGWIFFGLIVGLIARFLMPGDDRAGLIVTTLLGVAGALLAGFLGQAAGLYGAGQAAGWIMSILGAVLILFLYRQVRRRRPA